MSERRDFPFYNGLPVEIGGRGWLIVLAAVLVAFLLLIVLPFETVPLNYLPAILFTGLPLFALAIVVGPPWRALFGRYGIKQFGISLGFAVLTVFASFAAGFTLGLFIPMTANPSMGVLIAASPLDLVLFLSRTFIQLIGEEVVTILPLLAVLWLCVQRFGLSRRMGLVIAVLVSTLWFAAMHLPTYDWNILQCLGTIGTARIVLTISYLVTRNLWVSAGAHIANDWTLFFATFIGGHLPIGEGA